MALRRFLSLPADRGPVHDTGAIDDTATVRRIVASLEALPADEARHLAGFAYVLGRAAAADLTIDEAETATMERLVADHGGLTPAQAVVVVEIAKSQARLYGPTEDYLVTREWARIASEEERLALLRCCYLVGAADETISAAEGGVLSQIASELGFDSRTAGKVRAEFADRLGAIQALRRENRGR